MMRARASASATREVSIVIQRRPHCSATIGGGAGAAGRVEDEIAGVGGHQDATLNDSSDCLNDVISLIGESELHRCRSRCCMADRLGSRSSSARYRSDLSCGTEPVRIYEAVNASFVRLPASPFRGVKACLATSTGNHEAAFACATDCAD